MTWLEQAECKGMSPSLFFPERGDVNGVHEAKKVCAACVVRDECLAANAMERDGIFGGLSPIERRNYRLGRMAAVAVRTRPPARHGTRAKYVTGCRCEACCEAQSIYDADRRERLPRCLNCTRKFVPHNRDQLYCSMSCGDEYRKQQRAS